MNILVTGSKGFIGQNVRAWLARMPEHRVWEIDIDDTPEDLAAATAAADVVFHLAGVNRPTNQDEFRVGNVEFTAQLCNLLTRRDSAPALVLSSSVQALLDNPYGASKRQAEELVRAYGERTGGRVTIYRLPNVFGKWCRPDYNSAVATFCHNIARDLPVTISDPDRQLELVHVDDVVRCWLRELDRRESSAVSYQSVAPTFPITLGRLVEMIRSFRAMRPTLLVPDLDAFSRKLYATYLSYLDEDDLAYDLQQRDDNRGRLAEFIKSETFGQIFVSRTRPGITRGNHYHHTKTEKFLVLDGEAMIRFRHVLTERVIEYRVRGDDLRVVDIPPGYTHSIENVGSGELITLFWASEVFNPQEPDTYALTVKHEPSAATP